MEPLLKDEVEKIVFGNNNKLIVKEHKMSKFKILLDKAIVLTVILTILVFYFFGRTAYGFYIGFKYYDLRFVENNTTTAYNE